jgi:hypothetical protein
MLIDETTERLERIEALLDDLYKDLVEMRKEQRDRHKDVVRILTTDVMRMAAFLRRDR